VNRILDVKMLRNAQFPEDAGAMAHPVRPESYQEINNFYTATVYNKGAEVIRMQQTLLGKAGFRRGMDLYFQRHDGQAVTIDDFVAAMEDANGVDFTQFKRWYSQAGTPTVSVRHDYSQGKLTLTLTQSCPPTPASHDKKPFHIPVRLALFDQDGNQLPQVCEVLELREAEQSFQFDGLQAQPLVSLLRDFSAPVILQQPVLLHELQALLRHETDGFAKWNAAQTLALDCLTGFYHSPPADWHVADALINAYQHVLEDDSLDMALRAELLTPPGFEDLAAGLTEVDVDLVEAARDFFRTHLGLGLFDKAQALYQSLWKKEDHAMHGEAYSRRRLRNVCLWMMMKADETQALSVCQQQFSAAKTMTDQMASFGLLVNCSQSAARQQAIDDFYQQWSHDELVLDKWFALQACCELPGTLTRVKALLSHPAFSLKNPNKVRALVGAFCQGNPRHFHAIDGSGYEFLSDMLIKMDKINPQIAARLATPFTRWQKLDPVRQDLMKHQLNCLAKGELSRDLRELVTKSLVV